MPNRLLFKCTLLIMKGLPALLGMISCRANRISEDEMAYPIWELAMGGGMLMAIVAIPHVIV